LDLTLTEHVAPKRFGGSSGPGDSGRPGFGLFQVDIQQGHLYAHQTQSFSHGTAQIAPTTGDRSNLSG
jgi:hypothetical protein